MGSGCYWVPGVGGSHLWDLRSCRDGSLHHLRKRSRWVQVVVGGVVCGCSNEMIGARCGLGVIGSLGEKETLIGKLWWAEAKIVGSS